MMPDDNAPTSRSRLHTAKSVVLAAVFALLAGCAAKHATQYPADPWEGYNRGVHAFNDTVDRAVLKPVATGYRAATPSFIRHRITSFFGNLGDISNAANNLLQGKPGVAASDVMRLLINSTFGIFGLFDVATEIAGLPKHEEDFGQTLAVWGLGAGPYFVVPFMGPSTVRDFPAVVVDFLLLSPLAWWDDPGARNAAFAVDRVNVRAGFLDKEKEVRDISPDFYAALRSFYLARRQHLIGNGSAIGGAEDIYREIENH